MQNFANFQIVRVEDFLSTSVAKRINKKSIDLLTLRSFAAIIIASRRSQNSHELVHNFQFVSYQSFFVLQFNWLRQQFIGYVYQPWQPPPEFFALISDTPQGCLINEMKSQILDCSTIEISLENGSWWIERSFTRIILFYSFIRFFRFRFEEINVNKSLHIVTVWDLMRYRHLKSVNKIASKIIGKQVYELLAILNVKVPESTLRQSTKLTRAEIQFSLSVVFVRFIYSISWKNCEIYTQKQFNKSSQTLIPQSSSSSSILIDWKRGGLFSRSLPRIRHNNFLSAERIVDSLK